MTKDTKLRGEPAEAYGKPLKIHLLSHGPYGSTVPQNNATIWGPGAQAHEPMRTFLHTLHNSPKYEPSHSKALNLSPSCIS